MAGVQDGQAVNQSVTNAAFLIKNGDDTTTYNIALASTDIAQGSSVSKVQREFNSIWSFIGGALNQVKTYLPTWATTNFGTASDTVKARIEAIDSKLFYRAGSVSLSSGATGAQITFSSGLSSLSYIPSAEIECSDSSPIFLQYVISSRTTGGFLVTFNAPTDSANYILHYEARGQN